MSHAQVLEFHTIFGAAVGETPSVNVPEKQFRYDLIAEEMEELWDALQDDNYVEIADALGDIIYVTYGAGVTFGLDLENTVAKGRELAQSLDMFGKGKTGILTQTGQEIILARLREALESKNPRLVEATLASIIISVEYSARILGIPLVDIVDAIHNSNLSKLGEDGKPIFIEYNGALKVGKGPNYKPPTDDIKRILKEL